MVDISSILRDNEILIELGGDINFSDVKGIRERIEGEVELYQDKERVVIDMQTVNFANHNFPNFLHDYNKQLIQTGRRLEIVNLEMSVYEMFNAYYSGIDGVAPKISESRYRLARY
jgi:MFS superfamily sulfate permease-like transporter